MGSVSVDQWTITVSLSPDASVAQVRISGAIDPAAAVALAKAAEQLRGTPHRTVVVDVSAVTFAGSTLINFLAQVRNAMPPDAKLVIRRATAPTRRLLALTGFESSVVMDDGRSVAA